jgi:hypothetical protein
VLLEDAVLPPQVLDDLKLGMTLFYGFFVTLSFSSLWSS